VQAPPWAAELVNQVYKDEGRDDVPALGWHVKNRKGSSGCAYLVGNRITIIAGQDPVDQKLVVLHECAHQLTKQGHTNEFWDKAWELFHRYQVPIPQALKRSGDYKKKAVAAYHRSRAKLEAEQVESGAIPTMVEQTTLDQLQADDAVAASTIGTDLPIYDELIQAALNSGHGLNSGTVFPNGQLWILSPRASKVLLYLLDKRLPAICTTYDELIGKTDIKRTNLYHALKELQEHALITINETSDTLGHRAGIEIMIQRPPASLPWQVVQRRRTALINEKTKYQDAITKIDALLTQLALIRYQTF
jgi:hypothetical protein